MTDLLLKRATASPGEVYNVMCEERIVGRIMLSADAQRPHTHPRLRANPRGSHAGVRQELAQGYVMPLARRPRFPRRAPGPK